MILNNYQKQLCNHIKSTLEHSFSMLSNTPPKLLQAMKYSVLNGGKYLRPLLVYATGESFGVQRELLDIPAISVELVHAYSLIHDDLPAMDNADLRRGIPSCHKKHGEATAILAGDALLTWALELLCINKALPESIKIKMVMTLANAAGPSGMVGGQGIDINPESKIFELDDLIDLHNRKTSALIKASIFLGAYAAKIDDTEILNLLDEIANKLGLAYQIQDDILDIESSSEYLGKNSGVDAKLNKATFPQLLGLDAAKGKVTALFNDILSCMDKLPCTQKHLPQLTTAILQRNF